MLFFKFVSIVFNEQSMNNLISALGVYPFYKSCYFVLKVCVVLNLCKF